MTTDPFDLNRFTEAQQHTYAQALSELRAGRKRTHWMWFIFPQFRGIGSSSRSQKYSIKSVAEGEAYLQHAILGSRLIECFSAILAIEARTANEVFGSPDDTKLQSCATLFAHIAQPASLFEQVLIKYFNGEADAQTLRLIGAEG